MREVLTVNSERQGIISICKKYEVRMPDRNYYF